MIIRPGMVFQAEGVGRGYAGAQRERQLFVRLVFGYDGHKSVNLVLNVHRNREAY